MEARHRRDLMTRGGRRSRYDAHVVSWSSRRIRRLAGDLHKAYGSPRHHNKSDPLDEMVFILLSSRTGENKYLDTYECLKATFSTWEAVLSSESSQIARCIGHGGLARKKERWLRESFTTLKERQGKVDLSLLSNMNTQVAEGFLTSLPGIGLKSARCILMYSLNRPVFPVDTHCRRVLSRLGIIEDQRLTDRVQNDIQSKIPSDVRYSLHVNVIAHGRRVCLPRVPRCSACFLAPRCAMARTIGT
jgi:endonuclease III